MFQKIDVMQLVDEHTNAAARVVKRLRNKREFIDAMNSVGQEFHDSRTDENEFHFEISDRYSGVEFCLMLTAEQSISDIKPLLAALVRTRLFEPATFTQSASACTWRFITLARHDDYGYPTTRDVTVVVIFADSQVCTLQPTGNMIPEMKVVCSDGTVYDAPTEDTGMLADCDE